MQSVVSCQSIVERPDCGRSNARQASFQVGEGSGEEQGRGESRRAGGGGGGQGGGTGKGWDKKTPKTTAKNEGVEEAKADKSGKIKGSRAGGVENGRKKRVVPNVWRVVEVTPKTPGPLASADI